MKKHFFFCTIPIFLFMACKKAPSETCDSIIKRIDSQTFEGIMDYCNAEPSNAQVIESTAFVTIEDNEIIILLQDNDGSFIDTTFFFDYTCQVFENIPSLRFFDENLRRVGAFNLDPDRIAFFFDYNDCINNTGFSGQKK